MEPQEFLNIVSIKSEEHNMYFEPCVVADVNTKRKVIKVEINNREGFYEDVIVCGNYFPKKNDKGLLILMGKSKYPFFIPQFFEGIYQPGTYTISGGDIKRVSNPDRKYTMLTPTAINVLKNSKYYKEDIGGFSDGSDKGFVLLTDIITLYNELCLKANIDANLMLAQARIESNFYPFAVSYAGARGWSQFMPGTWVAYSSRPFKYTYDVLESINAQVTYMADNYNRKDVNGNTRLALETYWRGHPTNGNVQYVDDILNYYSIYIK